MQNWIKDGYQGSRDLWGGEFWDHILISGAAEARNSKFDTPIDYQMHYRKNCKIGSKGVDRVLRDHFWAFWDPFYISVTDEARKSKFRSQIDHELHYRKNAILGQRGCYGVTWPNFWNFRTPSISRELLKLESRILSHGLVQRCSIRKKC